MQGILYFITLPFIYLLSLLPFPILYGFSDLFYIILFRILGYRKKVTFQNLQNAFPEKSGAEIRKLRARFYRYFCDLFLETFKTLSISKAVMLRHCTMTQPAQEIFEKYQQAGQNVIIVMGHFGNWEWAGNSFSLCCRQQLFVLYHPLRNPYFNRLMTRMRTRFGAKLIAMKDTYRDMVRHKAVVNATAFIADQTPAPDNAYWTRFLNQETPVFWGTERISRKMNYPIVYIAVKRVKRGYYHIEAEVLADQPKNTKDGELSELHTRRLERDILEQPEIWLWSHRRWKHKRPDEKKMAVT